MRISIPLRYFLFFGWLSLTTAALLAPADAPRADPAPRTNGVAQIRSTSSALVIWAAKDGPLWHVTWFLGLGALVVLLPAQMTRLRKPLVLFIALNVVSLVTEIVQETLIPGRAFEWSDLAFNGLGIALGLIPVAMVRIRKSTLAGNGCHVRLY